MTEFTTEELRERLEKTTRAVGALFVDLASEIAAREQIQGRMEVYDAALAKAEKRAGEAEAQVKELKALVEALTNQPTAEIVFMNRITDGLFARADRYEKSGGSDYRNVAYELRIAAREIQTGEGEWRR